MASPNANGFYEAVDFAGYINNLYSSPISLTTDEGLEFYCDAGGDGTTAQAVAGLVWYSDGEIVPTKGKIFTLEGTISLGIGATGWTNSPITFSQTLPVGKYQVVGMQVNSGVVLAARLVFIGPSSITRPGVASVYNSTSPNNSMFRFGSQGVMGEFNSATPPSVDMLMMMTSSNLAVITIHILLDLIRVA